MEVWEQIKGYEGLYSISSLGVVKKLKQGYRSKEKNIKHSIRSGYKSVCLCKNNIKRSFVIHRIVAIHFIPNPENKPQINHINGDKMDNRAENLEWSNASENAIHAFRLGLRKKKFRTDNPSAKSVEKYLDGIFVKRYEIVQDTAQDGFLPTSVALAARTGRKLYGFHFKYPDQKIA